MRRSLLVLGLLLAVTPASAKIKHGPPLNDVVIPPPVVVALVDTGINPYNISFRDRSPLAYKHPSTYIPGYPKSAKALRLSIGLPYDVAMKRDAKVWASLDYNKLYWIPGTRIIGAISFGSGGTSCPVVGAPPANSVQKPGACSEHIILDDHGHGTMTASRAAGATHSLAPEARIVEIEGLGASSLRWAADAGWIDVISNSWLSTVPPPGSTGVSSAFAHAATRALTLAASGNGAAFGHGFAPTPTYQLSTAAPGVVVVGGHDNGRMTLWSGAPPHVVADAYGGWAALHDSSTTIEPNPIACCTSAAAPYAAGGAAFLVQQAREILGDRSTGVRNDVIAQGRYRATRGPLSDGKLTLDELRTVLLETAEARPAQGRDDGLLHWAGSPRPPDETEFGLGGNPFCEGCTTTPVEWKQIPAAGDAYQQIGYGAINERSVLLGVLVLEGAKPMPSRPTEDADYQRDQAIRSVIFTGE